MFVQHRRIGAIAGVAALLTYVGPATAVAAPAGDRVTLRFDEVYFEYDSEGFDRFEVGAKYTVTSELWRPGKTRRVGTTRTDCTTLEVIGPAEDPDNVRSRCAMTLALARGTMRAEGVHDWRGDGSGGYDIVGGTGRYAGADGRLTRRYLEDAKNRLTLRFSTD